ncbi:single-strand DNA-binding protein [Thermosulfidibacter takaii ABI70S6]|uniref:Single-stranded DNA-binding protein n=1 Tax=Thermosulfidibacter takaii (strain DSM 17441 / JCM 13301 / NBRC 103674 / ABI70S6) TaxID=1298851 RepID=A0A0S3QVU2_THET7|nr:single-stranded DNA-binding protein [Thermosulfidibacter takaii]BAT72451.1 single-strand DNA-binding protein [Thermosulfidibacter takaii ABI70S6]
MPPVYINKVFLAGNLTKDPEMRYMPSGSPVTNFRLAVNRRFRNRNGEEVEEVCFIDVVVYGRMAEICNEYLSKGRNVLVEGRLRYETWETDVGRRSKHVVVADSVKFLGGREEEKAVEEEEIRPDLSGVDLEDDDEFPF